MQTNKIVASSPEIIPMDQSVAVPLSDNPYCRDPMTVGGPRRQEELAGVMRIRKFIFKNVFFFLVLLGVVVGLVTGVFLKGINPSQHLIAWLGLPGEMFMRLLNMAILPLLMSNIISVTSRLDLKTQGKITLCTVIYMIVTNIVGALGGLTSFAIIRPGSRSTDGSNAESKTKTESKLEIQDMFADLIRNLIPENLFEATLYTSVSRYSPILQNVTKDNGTDIDLEYKLGLDRSWGTNILGLVVCSIIFGLIAGQNSQKTKYFIEFFEGVAHIMTIFMNGVIWFLPVGVCSLIISSLLKITNLENAFISLGWFILTVSLAVIFHQLVILQLMYFIIVRRNPFKFYISLGKSWITSFAATSSLITIPSLFTACDNVGIDYRVSRSVIPVAVNSNADGSSAFICVATLFIAELTGNSIAPGRMVAVALLSALNVMALPAIPSASIIAIVILLKSFNISTEPVALLFATEFILDRIRTTTNVMSHGYCAAVVNKICGGNLDKQAVEYDLPVVLSRDKVNGVNTVVMKSEEDGKSFTSL